MWIINRFNDLKIKNYTITDEDMVDDVMIIHGFSKDILKTRDTLNVHHNSIIKTKYYGNKLSYKILNLNSPLLDFQNSKQKEDKEEDIFLASLKKYGIAETIIMNKSSEDIMPEADYRIYDSLIFVNESFFSPKRELNKQNFFNIYENSLFNYCMQYNKEIISYTVRENERGNGEFSFDIHSPIRKHGTIGDLLYHYLAEYLKFINLSDIPTLEIARKVKEFFRKDSLLMKNLTNFWISFIFSKIFKRYEDIELLVFHFGEKLFPINIEEIEK